MFDTYANRHPKRQPQTWLWGGRPQAGMMGNMNSVAIDHEASRPVGKFISVRTINFTEVKLTERLHPSSLFLHSFLSTHSHSLSNRLKGTGDPPPATLGTTLNESSLVPLIPAKRFLPLILISYYMNVQFSSMEGSLFYIPIWLRPFSFLSQPRLQKGKNPTSLLLLHWHLGDFLSSFFLSMLVERAGSMYWLGNCTPIFEPIGYRSVYFSHLGQTFTPFRHSWTRESVPRFF